MYFEKVPAKKTARGYSWKVRYQVEDADGIVHTYTKSGFPTKKAAAVYGAKQLAIKEELFRQKACPLCLNDCFEKALLCQKEHLAPSSISNYTNAYSRFLAPEFGEFRISELDAKTLQPFFLRHSSLSNSYLDLIKHVLGLCFQYAIDQDYLEHSPMGSIKFPARKPVNVPERFERWQMEELTGKLQESRTFNAYSLCIFVYLGFFLGLRRSEIMALRKEDFDLDHGLVLISKRVETHGLKVEEYYETDRLKTGSSKATLPLCPSLQKILKQWFEYNPHDLLVCKKDGSYFSAGYLYEVLRKKARACGFKFHPHLLRHGFISELIVSGVDVKTAASLARHQNVKTTLEIYTQISLQDQKNAVNRVFG